MNGVEVDLVTPLEDGSQVSIITSETDQGLETIRHSTAHILAQAVFELYPGATFAIGPPIENGFYYDFDIPDGVAIKEEELEKIEQKMRQIIQADQALYEEKQPLNRRQNVLCPPIQMRNHQICR